MCEGIKDSKNPCPRIQKDLKLIFEGAEMGDEANRQKQVRKHLVHLTTLYRVPTMYLALL